jgi:DNA primase
MARIPETEIERLKNEISVERLIESSGIELKKSGKDLTGKCPFHEDDTASLVVTPAKNLWHCFGCGAAGGPIDWVMKKNGVSFRHAVELLREGLSSLAASPVKRTSVRALEAPVQFDADDQALLNQVIGYYHETLKQSPEALAYLQARGLDAAEAIEHFKLGYANRTLGLRLPEKTRLAGADIRTRLQKIGIYRESGHEHFNGSLIVPVLDEHGNAVEVYGRKIRDDLRKGTPKHLYLPEECRAGTRGVFNLAALQASKEIILTEALIDALTFWCAGYRNVTSAYGIEGFTEDHLAAFKRYGTQRVLIAFDRDEAGERGAAKVSELLMPAGIECYRIQFPKGMDANEYTLKVTPASHSLGLVIRKAVWLGNGKPPVRPEAAPVIAALLPAVEAAPVLAPEPSPLVPMPASAPPDVPCTVTGNEILITLGQEENTRSYRVRGLAKNASFETLKVNLLASCGERFYVDTLDLYAAKQRSGYLTQAAIELQVKEEILKADLGRVLLRLEQLQQDALHKSEQPAVPVAAQMSEPEREAALELLRAPDLVARILCDFAACGLVGEETNKLVGYLAAVSRKLDRPLGVVIQSSSAAGKSSLMDAVLAFVPAEDKVKYSAMTGQSLFYMGESNLKHKALAIVEEEGASKASYALKLLQSEGELTIASTGKDPLSGNLVTQQYRVEGPVALMVTTTARDIDEELMNRCLVLSVDEGREQTRAIHQLQRDKRTLQGLIARRDKEALIALQQNAQRLLKPLAILNPYAQFLTFPDQTTRLRRDHEKYLTLIDTLAFLHQHQRDIKAATRGAQHIEYIEVNIDDIELANKIAHDVLGRSLDELPPQTRRLLKLIDGYVVTECARQNINRPDFRFSRRALREAINWGDTQLRMHLERLVELEYVVARREGAGGKYTYELAYVVDGETHAQVAGIIEVDALKTLVLDATMSKSRGETPEVAGRSRGDSAPVAAKSRDEKLPVQPILTGIAGENDDTDSETHLLRPNGKIMSYPQPLVSLAAAAHD